MEEVILQFILGLTYTLQHYQTNRFQENQDGQLKLFLISQEVEYQDIGDLLSEMSIIVLEQSRKVYLDQKLQFGIKILEIGQLEVIQLILSKVFVVITLIGYLTRTKASMLQVSHCFSASSLYVCCTLTRSADHHCRT